MKQITEDYVSFEIAVLLKEKGFPQDYDKYHGLVYNEKDYEGEYEVQRMVLETIQVKAGTLHSYPVGVPEPKCYCPTQSLALKWLREVYSIHISVQPDYSSKTNYKLSWCWSVDMLHNDCFECKKHQNYIDTYEEACGAALNYVLKNLI